MSKTICQLLALVAGFRLAEMRAEDVSAKFLGANSCASSSCHGGGGPNQNQFLVWSLKDFHAQRPAATLSTARARQIAAALGGADATTDQRCTTCHAPLRDVPEHLRGKDFNVSEGVSCESCHGPAGNWLRSHTRADYSHADRTAAGMRDLENLYARANTCVACHQVVAQPLLQAGHPELIFELDGQSVAEPKHWSAAKNGISAQAWFVGQAVALRETSWELAREKSPQENEVNRWSGLLWLMARASKIESNFPEPPPAVAGSPVAEDFYRVRKWSDELARNAAGLHWTDAMTQSALVALAGASADFRELVPQAIEARRAERLVLALDRLLVAQKNPQANAELDRLFKLAQSLPDFVPKDFAAALAAFSKSLAPPAAGS